MVFFIVALITGLLFIVAMIAAFKNSEKERRYFIYNECRYEAGTEFLIRSHDSNQVVNAIFLYYDLEKKLNYYEPNIGNQVVHCTDEWFFSHIIEITGRNFNISEFKATKAKYNNFMYTCPMCQSKKIKSISSERKAASIMLTGLASKNIGHNYQCDNCNYKW